MRASLRIATALCAGAIAFAALPSGQAAARPSLVDLDANLTSVIDALCNGDAATCGTTPPLTVAGQLELKATGEVIDFVSLRFGFQRTGSVNFDTLEATLARTSETAQLLAYSAAGLPQDVDVHVPNPSGPGNTTILSLSSALFLSVDTGSDPQSAIQATFTAASFSWLGQTATYNQQTQAVSGCSVQANQRYIALAGNPASLLGMDEFEADYGFSVTSPPLAPQTLSFAFSGDASQISPCYLREAASGSNFTGVFHRLAPESESLGMQLREETVEFTASTIDGYELQIENGGYSENVALTVGSGKLTSRTFDAAGNETSSEAWPF